MIRDEVLAQYDALRRTSCDAGMRREEDGEIVRLVGIEQAVGCVVYSRLDVQCADAAIVRQREYFHALNFDFEWKWHSHDQPQNLQQRLIAHGFEAEEAETILVLALDEFPEVLNTNSDIDIRRVEASRELEDLRRIEEIVWGRRERSHIPMLARELAETPDLISIYIAYVNDEPAAGAFLRIVPDSPFAGLWGGSTIPAYRNRGLYQALVGVRAREARARGVRYLTVDARPSSRPILQKIGFEVLTESTPMIWRNTSAGK